MPRMDKDLESIQEAQNSLQAAHDAWLKFENFTEERVERILLEMMKLRYPLEGTLQLIRSVCD